MLIAEGVAVVWSRYLGLLEGSANPLLDAGPEVRRQLREQVSDVLTGVAARFGMDPVDSGEQPAQLSERIGRSRAVSGVHPSQSLRAASMIFEAALPVAVEWAVSTAGVDPQSTAATVLNQEILERMSLAARGYVDLLLDRIHESNQLERRSLSRGLHDVIAPAIAVGIQDLELYDVHRDEDPDRASAKLVAARKVLMSAVTDIRSVSEYLRVDIGQEGLVGAVEKVLDNTPAEVARDLRIVGPIDDIAPAYAQEIFLIVREAVRNAIQHAAPSAIKVELRIRPGQIEATVVDDGHGFDHVATVAVQHHVGLDSMNERAELLSGTVSISTAPGKGTIVRVLVPFDAIVPADYPTTT